MLRPVALRWSVIKSCTLLNVFKAVLTDDIVHCPGTDGIQSRGS